MMIGRTGDERTPAKKLLFAILIGVALAIPLFSVWLLVYDRQSQSQQATASITQGWGGPQTVSGPLLVIPYRTTASETVIENGRSVTRSRDVVRELTLAPERVRLRSSVSPERRTRSIYEAVVYDARFDGQARFAIPPDLSRHGVEPENLDLARAELRFGISDPKGLGSNPQVTIAGRPLRLQPGAGSNGGPGFFAWVDAQGLMSDPLTIDFNYGFHGNSALALSPRAGETEWTVTSRWPHPSFGGDFLPDRRTVSSDGFTAAYRIGNLALGRALVTTNDAGAPSEAMPAPSRVAPAVATSDIGGSQVASIDLVQPVNLYSRVDRSAKYGFLFIAFTFAALLMFDVVGKIRVSPVEYLLMGAALVLFFVLLLAFAEVIGFTPAYIIASAAIAGLNTAYSAAVLDSWRRALLIGGLLIALYAVLYVLLSLEAFSLLIGSLLLFAALAGVMYATRRLDWGARTRSEDAID